ncbi:MAG: 4Fe-4S binding protein [Anaerolineaceae bacterium]|nr:4Fe-4S binding protein [Anaerolineaceae bacterium]
METSFFHHALNIREDICNGCSLCIRVCPTEALRIRNGKAHLIEDRCVDCGECFRKCPVHAIIIEQDDFSRIYDYKHRVALVPAVLHGQFKHEISMAGISAVLRSMGFTWVYEVEHGAEAVRAGIADLMTLRTLPRPLISTFCPAIVRLIQVKYPSLIRNFATVKSPVDMAAFYCRKVLRDNGSHNADIGVFYVTPCAAKIAAVKSPVGEENSPITGVINMDFIFNMINRTLRNKHEIDTGEEHPFTTDPSSLLWSLTNGEADNVEGSTMAIDGMNNVMEFLEKLENDEISGIDYLEIIGGHQGYGLSHLQRTAHTPLRVSDAGLERQVGRVGQADQVKSANTNKGKERFSRDITRNSQCLSNNERTNNIGEYMAEHNSAIFRT